MELFMIEGKTHFYETEVEWSGAKRLNLAGGKQAATAAGMRDRVQASIVDERWSREDY
jgi:hypothetical protein